MHCTFSVNVAQVSSVISMFFLCPPVRLEVCPHKDMQCMKVTMREMHMDVHQEIHQEFGCDTAQVCQQEVEQQCTFVTVSIALLL